MRPTVLAFLLACLFSLSSFAGAAITLDFGGAGSRAVWSADAWPDSAPTNAVDVDAATYEFKSTPPGSMIFVWDKTSGNVAAKKIAEIRGTWTLAPADFKRVGKVTVRVEYKGEPVQAAVVDAQDAAAKRSQILDATANGEAAFYGVAPGSLKVSVSYRTGEKTAEPLKQTFELALKRDKPDPVFVVALADEVAVIEPAAGSAGTGGGNATEAKGDSGPQGGTAAGGAKGGGGGNPLGNIITFLIVLALAAAAVWFGLKWMKDNQSTVKKKLQDLGVEIPEQVEAVANIPAAPIAPEPPQKIILGDADPNIPAAPMMAAASAPIATPTGFLRLISDSGQTFELAEGESVVSREAGAIVIPGDTTVSRKHATVVRAGDSVSVRDEGSTNGTFVNGMKVSGDTPLRPGDHVQFGAARFRFEA